MQVDPATAPGFFFSDSNKKKPRTVSDGGLCMVGRDRLELPTFCV